MKTRRCAPCLLLWIPKTRDRRRGAKNYCSLSHCDSELQQWYRCKWGGRDGHLETAHHKIACAARAEPRPWPRERRHGTQSGSARPAWCALIGFAVVCALAVNARHMLRLHAAAAAEREGGLLGAWRAGARRLDRRRALARVVHSPRPTPRRRRCRRRPRIDAGARGGCAGGGRARRKQVDAERAAAETERRRHQVEAERAAAERRGAHNR